MNAEAEGTKMTEVVATLTEVRNDGMQKWERPDLPKQDHMRYIWINPYQSIAGVKVGSQAKLIFSNGTGGMIGGHWSVWKVKELLKMEDV